MVPCAVCKSRGNFHLVLFESDEQGGDQYASQEMTYHAARQIPESSEVVDLKDMLVQINWFVSEHRQLASRYYHEFKEKLFDVVNYSVR